MRSPSSVADSGPADRRELRRAQPLLGTLVEIAIAPPADRHAAHEAIDQAFRAIAQIHVLMSRQDPASELCRLNRATPGVVQRVSLHTAAVLRAALRIAQASRGAFDPTLRPEIERMAGAARPGSWHDITLLDECTVRFERALQLDLGGIAKGYAVDRAAESLLDHGFADFLVNAGGDVRVAGKRTIWLRDPRSGAPGAHGLHLEDQALATSGSYFSIPRADEPDSSHLIDPSSGRRCRTNRSVSVLAADCLRADALTKVVLFAPPALAERVLAAEGAQAIVLAPALAPAE